MPTEFAEDRHQLAVFVQDIAMILEQICFGRFYRLLPRHAHFAEPAWAELSQREVVPLVLDSIRHGNDADARPETTLTDAALATAALVGHQLTLKLEGYTHWRRKLAETSNNLTQSFSPGGIIDRMLQKLLKWANIILKSLASALPGAEALVEMKDSVEEAIEEAIAEE